MHQTTPHYSLSPPAPPGKHASEMRMCGQLAPGEVTLVSEAPCRGIKVYTGVKESCPNPSTKHSEPVRNVCVYVRAGMRHCAPPRRPTARGRRTHTSPPHFCTRSLALAPTLPHQHAYTPQRCTRELQQSHGRTRAQQTYKILLPPLRCLRHLPRPHFLPSPPHLLPSSVPRNPAWCRQPATSR